MLFTFSCCYLFKIKYYESRNYGYITEMDGFGTFRIFGKFCICQVSLNCIISIQRTCNSLTDTYITQITAINNKKS